MKPSRLALTAAPLLALSVAACGTASPAPPRATASARPMATASARASASAAAQFAAAADQICAAANQREAALGPGLINADVVSVAHLPKAAAYLGKVVAIKSGGLTALHRLAATGSDQAARQAFVRDYQNVIADYRDAGRAASRGDMAAFRADFGRVAPHGYPTGPDARALDRAAAPFPFRACGKGSGI